MKKKIHSAEREYYSKLGKKSAAARRKRIIEAAKKVAAPTDSGKPNGLYNE